MNKFQKNKTTEEEAVNIVEGNAEMECIEVTDDAAVAVQ